MVSFYGRQMRLFSRFRFFVFSSYHLAGRKRENAKRQKGENARSLPQKHENARLNWLRLFALDISRFRAVKTNVFV